jgi:hypothetical protein
MSIEKVATMKTILPAPLTRRAAIGRLGGTLGSLGLATLLADLPAAEAATARTHFAPRSKRVIHLFMNGGPFQGDFFDPKPALTKYAGQRPKEVDLRTERATAGLLPVPFSYEPRGKSGLPISELLPQLSTCADDLCILRSVHSDNPNHGPALYQMNNGTITPKRPSMGSWLLYGLGTKNENLPGYVVLCPGRPVRFAELWSSAFLPAEFQGTYINHSNLDPQQMLPFLKNAEVTKESQRKQLDLLQALNREHLNARGSDDQLETRIKALESAFRMQTEAAEAFDLQRETAKDRAAYGSGHFADACLLARRLAERGVRFTQIYYGDGQPWDTHTKHNEQVRNLAKSIDQPIAALLNDLKQRGMLDETLVVWGGEFGRTPVSESGDGRDHNHYGFTMFLAGGGVRGGLAYGATDEFGFRAVEDKVHVHDLHATLLHLLGFDHERLTYRYSGREFRLTDVHGRVVKEILA